MKKLLSMAALLTLMAIAFFPGTAQASWSFKLEYAGIPATTPTQPSATPTPPALATKPEPATTTPQPANGLTPDEAQMLAMINQERTTAGLAPVTANMTLTQLAREKSQDMLTNSYFAHQSPTYGSAFDMMKSAGVSYTAAGENLAKARDAAWAEERLLASPGHAANILNPNFTQVGLGVIPYTYGVVVTQMYVGN